MIKGKQIGILLIAVIIAACVGWFVRGIKEERVRLLANMGEATIILGLLESKDYKRAQLFEESELYGGLAVINFGPKWDSILPYKITTDQFRRAKRFVSRPERLVAPKDFGFRDTQQVVDLLHSKFKIAK